MIEEGVRLVEQALRAGPTRPYAIQAAIAALHDEAASTETTDWPQIVALYDLLGDNPMARLSRAIAVGMVDGAAAGLVALDEVDRDPRVAGNHRLDAARGHLLERAGDPIAAIACYRRAAHKTASASERDYLLLHAARLAER